MKLENTGKRSKFAVIVAQVCLLGVMSAVVGFFNPKVNLNARIPDIPKIPAVRNTQYTELGYGYVKTTDGKKIYGWWRRDRDDNAYHKHEAPKTKSGLPTGYEKTIQVIPEKRVIEFRSM